MRVDRMCERCGRRVLALMTEVLFHVSLWSSATLPFDDLSCSLRACAHLLINLHAQYLSCFVLPSLFVQRVRGQRDCLASFPLYVQTRLSNRLPVTFRASRIMPGATCSGTLAVHESQIVEEAVEVV